MIEFYQEDGDPQDDVFVKMHKEILEKVNRNNADGSYTSFLIDTTDLGSYLNTNPATSVQLSVTVPSISDSAPPASEAGMARIVGWLA